MGGKDANYVKVHGPEDKQKIVVLVYSIAHGRCLPF